MTFIKIFIENIIIISIIKNKLSKKIYWNINKNCLENGSKKKRKEIIRKTLII